MKIRILQPTVVRLEMQPGDTIAMARPTPEIDALLIARRLDNVRVAEIVADDDADEKAVIDKAGETATTSGGRRGPKSAATVSG